MLLNSQALPTIMAKVATGEMNVPEATDHVEAIHWLTRVSIHLARITNHLTLFAAANGEPKTP